MWFFHEPKYSLCISFQIKSENITDLRKFKYSLYKIIFLILSVENRINGLVEIMKNKAVLTKYDSSDWEVEGWFIYIAWCLV